MSIDLKQSAYYTSHMGERFKSFGMKGKNHSEETKQRLKEWHTKNPANFWLGKKMSEETKKKMSEAGKARFKNGYKQWNTGISGLNSGSKNPMWKGGVSSINARIRSSADFKNWRKSVFERDNYACVICNSKSKKGKRIILNADHIKPFAYFLDLRFELSNGRTLCLPCHKKTDTYGRKTK